MADERSAATMIQEIEFAPDSPLEGWREMDSNSRFNNSEP